MENLKSLRDCLEEGLQKAGRTTFLYRVIYVGQHDYDSLYMLKDYFQNNVDECNSDYCDEKLTGFLLCYEKLLIHLFEGSEELIFRHFNLLCNDIDKSKIHDLRIIFVWPHIISRVTLSWLARTGQPHKSTIEVFSTCQPSPYVQLCLNSMCRLSELIFRSFKPELEENENIDNELEYIKSVPDELITKLPDPDQIEFLTKCPVLVSLEEVHKSMYHITRFPYTEVAWPAPSVYIPYDLLNEQDGNLN